ncbi:hypothetical protein O181_095194 [Austropuccinia psidii MF-1]|uniref:Uncharacterized protein n=1 Tax=Austropuccinia psidii MF-1 TaxID=1389203 RepID=A0A9Q3J4M0_9BASI|nr:hypothetical protein [Austropuccinia psidii MF-1]
MLPQIHKGVKYSWNILKNSLKEEEIVRYSSRWNPLSSKPQLQKIKKYDSKKREARKEYSPVAPTRNPQFSQPSPERKKNKKNNWRKPYYLSYRTPRIQKDAMYNVLNMARNLMEFKDQ